MLLDSGRVRRLADVSAFYKGERDFSANLASARPHPGLARFPIRWSHLIEKNSRQFKNLEHVLGGKAGPLFRDML
jgi:hypothetical protein